MDDHGVIALVRKSMAIYGGTQAEFALACGVSQSLISQFLSGTKRPGWRTCRNIEDLTQGQVSRYQLRPDILVNPALLTLTLLPQEDSHGNTKKKVLKVKITITVHTNLRCSDQSLLKQFFAAQVVHSVVTVVPFVQDDTPEHRAISATKRTHC